MKMLCLMVLLTVFGYSRKAIQRYSEVYKKNEGNFLHFT